MTTTAEQLEQWRGRKVVDAEGEDVGRLDEIYYAATGEPALARITYGLLGRHRALVPLTDSSVGRDYLRVAYPRTQIEQVGAVEIGETIDPREAAELGAAYGIALPAADRGYESAAQIAARREQAEAAEARAAALEEEARQLDHDAASRGQQAAAADASATEAMRDAESARIAAAAARDAADAAAASLDPPPTTS
jgi:hypothetical protein